MNIQFRCPATGALMDTGIAIPVDSFVKASMHRMLFACSACGGFHQWQDDGYSEASDASAPAGK
jgi:hypothetical protein